MFFGVPAWLEVLALLFGGGLLKAVIDLIRSREGPLWQEIARLNIKLDGIDKELDGVRRDHNIALMVNQSLKGEVNDLLEELGRDPKYDLSPKG